ncbi:hypothetical protein G7Y89_g14250 [Cudoniella acicularis]|uniref:Vps72/YL1 C-terminal domain-containing protein n=1 Tax=Cudoniella acicularis TaxID=354080 RepID=A0A8H4R5X3_9HELO|nr:hypothetical protein G7Y89_g14250 [Cudoniella acicularis]
MADDHDEDTPMRSEEDDSGSGSESEEQEQEPEVEWLVTSRQRRSTAGNRLTSLLQQEEPDDELELLFAEDEEDEVFEDADDQSDVQMDSSDDDDDQGPAAGADDLDGEKELQKQSQAERKAKRRKLNDGIPKVMRRKVKIDPTASQAPAPRPKKKSERASWIPTAEDAPTRASARGTTKKSKQQLHKQMIEREIKRLRQLANMEKAAAAKEAAKKPPMTQADRLREAAKIEKANSKSLSRWEEMEQQREEEQRERLAKLQNRTMEGPVITWWSGMAEWVGGKLRKVGRSLTINEKEKAGRKRKAAEMEADEARQPSLPVDASIQPAGDSRAPPDTIVVKPPKKEKDSADTPNAPVASSEAIPSASATETKKDAEETSPIIAPPVNPIPQPSQVQALEPPRPSPILAPPPMHGPYPPPPNPNAPRASSVLAPPPLHPAFIPQPPNQASRHPNFQLAPPIQPAFDGSAPLPGFGYNFMATNPHLLPGQNNPFATASQPPPPQPSTPPPPAIEHAAINHIILSNFDETAIKDKDVQTQILFNRKFHKAPSRSPYLLPSPSIPSFSPPISSNHPLPKSKLTCHPLETKSKTELCAITSYPAKYRDPLTGLLYCNSFAYKEIQRLQRGDYKWSKLVGAYVGQGTYAARGVPERFLGGNPLAPKAVKADGQVVEGGSAVVGESATGSGSGSG